MKKSMDELIQRAQELAAQSIAPLAAPVSYRVAYLVSHGHSYASNGYAIRTQGIARALNEHGLETLCFVRPGRPWELDNAPEGIPAETTIHGVRYVHSRWEPAPTPASEREHLEASVQRLEDLCRIYRPAVLLAASDYRIGLPGWVVAQRLGLPFHNEVRGFWELSRAAREPGYEQAEEFRAQQERDAFVARQAQSDKHQRGGDAGGPQQHPFFKNLELAGVEIEPYHQMLAQPGGDAYEYFYELERLR